MESGSIIDCNEEHELKALSPMYLTDDSSMLIFWMDDRQPKKATDPIHLTEAGILISLKDEKFRNALSGIDKTDSCTCRQMMLSLLPYRNHGLLSFPAAVIMFCKENNFNLFVTTCILILVFELQKNDQIEDKIYLVYVTIQRDCCVAAWLCPIPFWPGPKIKNCNEGSHLKLSQKSLLVLVKSGAHNNFEIQKKNAKQCRISELKSPYQIFASTKFPVHTIISELQRRFPL
jgi:hypothetical protein